MSMRRRTAPLVCAPLLCLGVAGGLAPSAPHARAMRSLAAAAAPASVPAGGRPAPTDASGRVPATGTTLPPAPLAVRLTLVTNAEQPIGVVARPGDDTLYVVEKVGRIRALRPGATSVDPAPVLDIVAQVSSENERGLLGLAFHPTNTGVLYIDYTDKRGAVTVSELPFDGRVADANRERVLLRIDKPFNEHNAGTIFFGPDATLYVAIGDGGGGGDQYNNGQRLDSLLGKILRIDPRPAADGTRPYSIPADNPFARVSINGPRARPEIFAYGLRNPWQTSLDPVTGELWIPDVGQNLFEEVNVLPAGRSGANFGWRLREGRAAFKGPRPRGAVDPVYDYPHKDGRCAVVGGAVYRGRALTPVAGWYVFGDVCSGQLSALQPSAGRRTWRALGLGARVSYLTAFGVGNDGELFATSLEGPIYRLDPAA